MNGRIAVARFSSDLGRRGAVRPDRESRADVLNNPNFRKGSSGRRWKDSHQVELFQGAGQRYVEAAALNNRIGQLPKSDTFRVENA